MTSIFDSLAVLGFRAKDQYTLIPLVDAVFDEAIKTIDALPQNIAKWERYKKINEKLYLKLYGDMGEFEMKMGFIHHAHIWLDHTDKWHCRIFKNAKGFEFMVYRVKNLLLAKKSSEAYFSIRDIHWRYKKQYATILEKLKEVLKFGRIPQPKYMNEATKKWLGEYKPWIPLEERIEEMKKDAEKAREEKQKEKHA